MRPASPGTVTRRLSAARSPATTSISQVPSGTVVTSTLPPSASSGVPPAILRPAPSRKVTDTRVAAPAPATAKAKRPDGESSRSRSSTRFPGRISTVVSKSA